MFFISLILPVFNRKKCIKRCLDSIFRQSFRDFEVIIVDDGSYDGTEILCETYSQRYENITVIHQENGGASKARNAGIKIADGQFITFIDSDDYIPLDYLQKIKEAYEKFGKDFLYCTSFITYSRNGNTRYFQYRKNVTYSILKGKEFFKLKEMGLFNSVCNKVYQTSVIQTNRIRFPEQIDLGEDIIFNLRYLDCQDVLRFVILNKNFYEVRETIGSLERGWRENYFLLQTRLLKEEIEFIHKWMKEKKIQGGQKTDLIWYYSCIRESIDYYVAHARNMSLCQVVKTVVEIKKSPEYAKYKFLCEKKHGLLAEMICNVIYYRLKETCELVWKRKRNTVVK